MSTWVLLRGLTRESGHWGDFPAQLAARLPGARVVAVDLPGNGPLYRQRTPLRVEDIAAACRVQLLSRPVEAPFHLLAMSLGGMVALAWAAARPAEVAGCVLLNTSVRGLSPLYRRLRPTSYPAVTAALLGTAAASEARILKLTAQQPPPGTLDAWIALRQRHPVSRLNALRQLIAAARFRLPQPPPVPMLVLSSAADALVDPRCSAELAARWQLPHLQHPTAGHDLALDAGPWVAEQVESWLRTGVPAVPERAGARFA
ncbi:alpha/beta fold hydrolase [Azoarcus olearius]|uniref:Hydrolase n=1 Tax=Azoarcus sp. (strain BH72) TaxID=418699 RepID=A1K7V7_AZOSB|nr:alpha/beta hydrolase [Azoarcus olearius]CAL94912.1 putative hydrolase [Azoarcus olearius]